MKQLTGARDKIGGAVASVGAAIALVILLGIVFVLFEANQDNAIVAFVDDLARTFVRPVGDLFEPRNPKGRVAINWGIAAGLYLLVTQLAAKALRR